MSAHGPYRLAGSAQRGSAVEFRFDGKTLSGVAGDTIASALLANGVRVVSRSFKFHRPRGVYSAGFEEPNAIFQLHSGARTVPGVRGTLASLTPGLEVASCIGWPSRSRDLLRFIDLLHPVFAAGFYNKTFQWPSWHAYERVIRKMAGLGRAPGGPDPDRYETQHAYCDVLVIGGGTSGVAAASRAAAAGKRVILVEQDATLGSQIETLSDVMTLASTMAVAYYDHDLVALAQTVDGAQPKTGAGRAGLRERLWLVRAGKVVLATGAIEQPLIFSNNDRPGIMLAGAACKYVQRHGVAPGRGVVVATNNDSAYAVVRELREAGVNVTVVVDSRSTVSPQLVEPLQAVGVVVRTSSMPVDTTGFSALESVSIGQLDGRGSIKDSSRVSCDALLVSGGWSPTLHLFAQAGGNLVFSEAARTFLPTASHPSIEIVGRAANAQTGKIGPRVSPVGNTSRQWLDLRHDVTVSDIELSVRENLTAVEHVKRYTTLGMSMDQGKVGQAPATEVIAKVRGLAPSRLGHTTFRPPFVPVTLGTLVGRGIGELLAPSRVTTLYATQAEQGAAFDEYSGWKRAAAFPHNGESLERAVHREAKLVRHGVGLFDASPLGKIELIGPDALDFADRFYINNLSTLKPGRVRYGIMLRESGVIFDDGTITILDADRVLLTTTSGAVGRVTQWLEEWLQCEWPQARVVIVPVTEQWASVALTGQHARAILERIKPDCDLSNERFPHLEMRCTRLMGSEARIARVSFSGELTYEINVPANKGHELWAALLEEGRPFDIAPYGVESLLRLRMEKGFLHIGVDTDGTSVPDDVGFGKPAAAKQRHYVGKRSLSLPENVRPDRLQLVGLSGRGMTAIPAGSHVRLPDTKEVTDGWVTSAGINSADDKPVALALLRAGRTQTNQTVTVHDRGKVVTTAQVVAPCFYDPTGARMNA